MSCTVPDNDDALVSCLMLTTPDRFGFATRSIEAYCRQTYAPRELVVLSRAASVADRRRIIGHVGSLGRPDIRVVFASNDFSLGAARNRSVAEARGRYVCVWDDDDLHHPMRLAIQLGALRASGRLSCYLQDVFQYVVKDATIYWSHWAGIVGHAHPGTLLADKAAGIEYPDTSVGEDTAVLSALSEAGQVHLLGQQPHLFVYVSHGRNLWSIDHHRMLVERLALPRDALLRSEAEIRSGLRIFELPADLEVSGVDGPAFKLGPAVPSSPGEPVHNILPTEIAAPPRPDPLVAGPAPHADMVSCLMLTTPARLDFAKRAISAYCQQTHATRELVVLSRAATGADRRSITRTVRSLGRPDIRVVFAPDGLTVGAARNLSIAEARGRFICTWDDDDLHHPSRLTDQLAAIRASGCQACYLGDVFQYIVQDATIFWTDWAGSPGGAHPGTLFADRQASVPYPDMRVGSDTAVLKSLAEAGRVHILAKRPELFVYVSHGQNLWSSDHHRMLIGRLSLPQAKLIEQQAAIRSALSVFALPADVQVGGPEGPAFMLRPGSSPEASQGRLEARPASRPKARRATSGPTILLAQEFGGNFGHVMRLVSVARKLEPARFVVAVPLAHTVERRVGELLGQTVEMVGSMGFRAPDEFRTASARDRTLADVFFNLGYAHRDSLDHAADRWRTLIDRVAPDLIVSEFAPTVQLASWDLVPVVAVGSSYETPPPDMHLPSVVPPGEPPGQTSLEREKLLLATARAVRARLGGPPLRFFGDLFQADRVFPTAPPGCDPYHALRRTPAALPFPLPDVRCGPPAAARTGPDLFCFLWSDHPWLNLILTALNGLPRRSEVHIRGIDPKVLVAQCAPQIGIRPEAADFSSLLPRTRVFLHYGGAAACYAGLLAGVVQIIVPIHLEQEMNARGMVANGAAVGLVLDNTATAENLREVIEGVLGNTALQASALAAAQRAWASRTPAILPEIVATCRQLLARQRRSATTDA